LDLAKSTLAEAYEDEGADIAVGTSSSARQLRCCPWPRYKKMLIVEPAVADKVTGRKVEPLRLPHRAIHRRMTTWPPAKRRSPRPGRGSTRRNVRAINAIDFTAPAQRFFDALKDNPEDHRDHFGRLEAILLANSAISTQAATA
jgi:branched-chain amino acid transport system substrate-binding protein